MRSCVQSCSPQSPIYTHRAQYQLHYMYSKIIFLLSVVYYTCEAQVIYTYYSQQTSGVSVLLYPLGWLSYNYVMLCLPLLGWDHKQFYPSVFKPEMWPASISVLSKRRRTYFELKCHRFPERKYLYLFCISSAKIQWYYTIILDTAYWLTYSNLWS